jgi:hypothetical protein
VNEETIQKQSLLWGYASCCAYYQGLSVKQSSATNVQDIFILYTLSQHVSAYLMAILRRIVQNIQRSCYSYNGSFVGTATSLNNLYDLPEDGHQIGRDM